MDGMDVDALADALKEHLPLQIVNTLKEQLVTEPCFMNLNESTLKLFNFPIGHIFAIMKVISEIREGKKTLVQSSGTVNPLRTNSSPVISGSRPKQNQNASESSESEESEGEKLDMLNSDDESDMEALSEYIEESYLSKAEPYLIASWIGRLKRWKSAIQFNMPHESAPYFSIPEEYLKATKEPNGDDGIVKTVSKTKSKGRGKLLHDKALDESCGSDKENANTKSGTRRSKLKAKSKKDVGPKRTSLRIETQAANKTGETTSQTSPDSSPISIRPPKRGRSNIPSSSGSSDDDDDDGGDKGRPTQVASFNAPLALRTTEELEKISPSLPSFDIESILLNDEEGKERTKSLVPILKEGKLLGSKERKRFFRKLVHHLCFTYVENPSKATASMREGLAKSIVATYPQYQKAIEVEGKTPWSYIWNVKGGHISNVIKRIQTALPDSKRAKKGKVNKRKKKKLPSCNIDMKQIGLLMPDRGNRVEIFDAMKKSFPLRTCAREKGSSITEILSDFPHLLNYSGELIGAEYQNMFPNSKDMCPDLAKFVPKVITNWDDSTIEVKCKDENLKACLIMASKLPHTIRSKSTIPLEEEVIVLVKPGVDLETFVAERRVDSKGKPIQPYLLGLRGQVTSEILKYFLVLDGNLLELGRIPFLRCIDWLFKTYVIFNVHYPSTWAQFFRFLQTCFYKIYFSSNDDIPPSSIDLFNKLSAL